MGQKALSHCHFSTIHLTVPGLIAVYLLPSRKMHSTRKTISSIERTIVSKNVKKYKENDKIEIVKLKKLVVFNLITTRP
jgi:hypothetical protein